MPFEWLVQIKNNNNLLLKICCENIVYMTLSINFEGEYESLKDHIFNRRSLLQIIVQHIFRRECVIYP